MARPAEAATQAYVHTYIEYIRTSKQTGAQQSKCQLTPHPHQGWIMRAPHHQATPRLGSCFDWKAGGGGGGEGEGSRNRFRRAGAT